MRREARAGRALSDIQSLPEPHTGLRRALLDNAAAALLITTPERAMVRARMDEVAARLVVPGRSARGPL